MLFWTRLHIAKYALSGNIQTSSREDIKQREVIPMYRGKREKPRRPKPTGRPKEKALDFILGVISGLAANLITSLVQKLLN